MKENKELEKINEVNSEVNTEKNEMVISNFGTMQTQSKTERKYFTTIELTDTKKLYNLDNGEMNHLLNDCEGQSIRVKDVLIKEFTHELDEPKVNEETGELIETETNKVCILIDDQNETYVTASKIFTNQMKRYISMFGVESIKNGLDIKIVKKKIKDSNNKSLAFELI